MSNVMDNRCPSCNAPIVYKPTLGKFKCDYCDSEFEAHELKSAEDSTVEVSGEEHYVSYNCPDCGAEIIADENTSATFCLYCGNSSILKNKLSGEFKPDLILPFRKEKSHAIEAFQNLKKGRPFMPATFNDKSNIEKITGLYIPFWLFDLKLHGSIKVTATDVDSWLVGNVKYVKTEVFSIDRGGNFCFDKIPVDGSLKFSNDIMNTLEPFDYRMLEEYNPAYLSGFLAEKYDVSKEDALPEASERAKQSCIDQMLQDINHGSKNVVDEDFKVDQEDIKYALLPVWMVNVKYKDKFYLFAMNGQSGEFIGDIPIDTKKVVIYTVVIFVISFIVCILATYIWYLLGGR